MLQNPAPENLALTTFRTKFTNNLKNTSLVEQLDLSTF